MSLESCYLGWEVHARAARAARLEEKRQLGKLTQQDLDVMRAAEQRASDDLQYEEAEQEYSRMSWEEDRIIKAVNAIPAKTEAGLRVRALLFVYLEFIPCRIRRRNWIGAIWRRADAKIVHLSARHRRGGRPDHHRYAGGRLIRPPSAARAASGRPSAKPAARL